MIRKGFTFIEVIIIFTIVFIMTAVLFSTSYKDRSKKEIEAVAREITASIRETQNNALTGKQKGNTRLPCTFQFAITSDSSYQMNYESRDIDGACDDAFHSFFTAIQLPPNVLISAKAKNHDGDVTTGVSIINFRVPYGDIEIGGDSANAGFELKVEKNDKAYYICVHSTGLIEELRFQDPVADDEVVCEFGI